MSGSATFTAKQRLLIVFSAFVLICGGFVGHVPSARAAVGCTTVDDGRNTDVDAYPDSLFINISASATGVTLSRSTTKVEVSGVTGCTSYVAADTNFTIVVKVDSGSSNNTVTINHSTKWEENFHINLGDGTGDKVVYQGTSAADKIWLFDSVLLSNNGSTTLPNVEKVEVKGGNGSDLLNVGNDSIALVNLFGDNGSDTLVGGPGDNVFAGGTGLDKISYDDDRFPFAASAAITFSHQTTIKQDTVGAGGDTCSSSCAVEIVEGSSYGDDLTAKTAGSILYGAAGDDTLTGAAGPDILFGGDDADTLEGLAGNDVLVGGAGDDEYEGGLGVDTISFDGDAYADAGDGVTFSLVEDATGQDTDTAGTDTCSTLCDVENLTGSRGADSLTGNTSSNVIQGLDGDDTIDGDKGNDVLVGGFGDDIFTGGSGLDTISYDDLTYADASDGTGVEFSLADNDGQNTGGADYDTLAFPDDKQDVENLTGSSGDDVLGGDIYGNAIDGLGGVDEVSYAASNAAVVVSLAGGASSGGHAAGDLLSNIEGLVGSIYGDTLTGGASNDRISGGAGADTITGGAGTDTLEGGTGDDSLDGGAGADALAGGDGVDKLSFASSTSGVTVTVTGTTITATGTDATGDTYSSLEAIVGSNFADRITGDAAANNLSGGGGNDVIVGGGGADVLSGGDGTDTVSYAGTSGAVQVNLSTGVVTGAAGDDSISSFETVVGTAFGDTLIGSTGGDTLRGGGGNDRLTGGSGADRLVGGGGNDRLSGGSGSDTLVGGVGDDTLDGGPETDTCRAGTGTNVLRSCP